MGENIEISLSGLYCMYNLIELLKRRKLAIIYGILSMISGNFCQRAPISLSLDHLLAI